MQLADVLHVACFYGCDKLVSLCERMLATHLAEAGLHGRQGESTPPAHHLAPWMLILAQECGLKYLELAALNHVGRCF